MVTAPLAGERCLVAAEAKRYVMALPLRRGESEMRSHWLAVDGRRSAPPPPSQESGRGWKEQETVSSLR